MTDKTNYPVEYLSASSVTAYLMCARAWRYRYIDKVEVPVAAALSFGIAFHEAIRLHVEAKTLGSEIDSIDELFAREWKWHVENEDIDYGRDTPESLEALGHKMLYSRDVMDAINGLAPQMQDDQPVMEHRIEFTIDGVPVPIIGFIDMIGDDGVPVDFKTAGKAWYSDRADSELQPAFYLEALRQADQMPNEGAFRYYIFTKTARPKAQMIKTYRTPAQLEWMCGVVRAVWQGIEAEVFPPNGVGSWKCSPKYCEYWDACHNPGR